MREGGCKKGSRWHRLTRADVIPLYEQGLRMRDCAELLGCSYMTVQRVLKRAGVKANHKQVRNRTKCEN